MSPKLSGSLRNRHFELTGHAAVPQDIRKEQERAVRSVMIYNGGQGRGVEVTEAEMVLYARELTWSREVATTSLELCVRAWARSRSPRCWPGPACTWPPQRWAGCADKLPRRLPRPPNRCRPRHASLPSAPTTSGTWTSPWCRPQPVIGPRGCRLRSRNAGRSVGG